jgi:hypothetical protein
MQVAAQIVAAVGVDRPVIAVGIVDVGWHGRFSQPRDEGVDGHENILRIA